MICHSLLQWTTFFQTSPPWPIHLRWPHKEWLSFTGLDGLWSMWSDRLANFVWLWFEYFCPLIPSCNTYHLTWVSLTLDVGYLFTAAPAKCSHFGQTIAPHSCSSWPWTWSSSSQLPLLGRGVAPLGQSRRKAMPKNVQTTTQLHSFHTLAK